MIVFAFDRHWTVDGNPHPRHEVVTLSWIRQAALDTDHAVYAIGDQHFADEVDIPGVVDVVERHPDDAGELLGEQMSDGRYETFPSRRDRLALIEDLHPNAEAHIVVDDRDLRDVDGWTHYHPREFVTAIEDGEIEPFNRSTRELISDGGMASPPAIASPDASAVASFLESRDSYGYELTIREDGAERTRLLHEVSIRSRTMERPVAAPTILCTPVSPFAVTTILDDCPSGTTSK